MKESLETHIGVWRLPNNPKDEIAGTLTIDKFKGYTLSLVGSFEEVKDLNERIDFIIGFTKNGIEITLYKCILSNLFFSMPGFIVHEFSANYVFIGYEFDNKKQLIFNECSFSFKDFDKWVDVYGFKKIDVGQPEQTLSLVYDLPNKIEFDFSLKISAQIKFGHSGIPISKQVKQFHIAQQTYLTFQSKTDSLNLKDIITSIISLRNFLSLAYYELPQIDFLKVYKDEIKMGEDLEAKEILVYVPIYWEENFKEKRSSREFLFNFESIRDNISEMFLRWEKIHGAIEPVVAFIIEAFRRSIKVNEFKFLSIIQGIETFHRRLNPTSQEIVKSHLHRIKEIASNLNGDDKNLILEKLQYAYEPSLRKRIKESFAKIPEEVIKKIILDRSDFINKIVDSRNYYTHYDLSLKDKALKGRQLYFASERLKVLLIALVLTEIGIHDEQFESIFIKQGYELFYHLFIDSGFEV